jgi:hypothetical protein
MISTTDATGGTETAYSLWTSELTAGF